MVVNAVALVTAFCCVAFLPEIPSLLWVFGVPVVVFLLAVLPSLSPKLKTLPPTVKNTARVFLIPTVIFLCGAAYAIAYASYQLSLRLPESLLGVELQLTGTITGLPLKTGRRLRFVCDIDSLHPVDDQTSHTSSDSITAGKLRLDWYGSDTPDLRAGDNVRLIVKLKAPSGFMNPGGFDFERWLTRKKIVATGYVRSKSFDVGQSIVTDNKASLPLLSLSTMRNNLQHRLLLASEGLSVQGVVLALSVGDRSKIKELHWNTFIETGTNHLLAISGLHISLVAGFVAFLASLVWRFTPLASKQTFALLCALLAAACYSAMAGFTVPTVRALTMFAVLAALMMGRRHQRRTHSLCIAVVVVCLSDPFCVLSPGFWMSFAAVAVLFMVFSDTRRQGKSSLLWRLLRGHVLVSVGLYPLTILFFQQASLIAPVANLLVTPIVAFLVTPLVFVAALIAIVSVPVAAFILTGANLLLELSLSVLMFLSNWPWALLKVSSVSSIGLLFAAVAALVLLVPVSFATSLICLVLVLPIFFPHTEKFNPDTYSVTFLDVGQGTAVVVRTEHHVLVYDTGDQFSPSFSAADAVIIPYLYSKGIDTIDKLIVSHADRDHSGGADELLDQMHVAQLITSAALPQRPAAPYTACVSGMHWMWDDVRFSFLHPRSDSGGSKNDMSCVLKISGSNGIDTLLPGDVEALGERSLMLNEQTNSIEILMSPHHGSLTSSGADFIEKTGARYVVHSAGYRNRFGFPKEEIVRRYVDSGAEQYRTDQSGAIEFIVSPDGIEVSEYRKTGRRWWHRM